MPAGEYQPFPDNTNEEFWELEQPPFVLDGVFNGFQTFYSLANVCYCVHPAANANFVAYIWRVAEFMHDSDMIGIWTLEELLLQCNCVNLQEKQKTLWMRADQMRKIRNTANYLDGDGIFFIVHHHQRGISR